MKKYLKPLLLVVAIISTHICFCQKKLNLSEGTASLTLESLSGSVEAHDFPPGIPAALYVAYADDGTLKLDIAHSFDKNGANIFIQIIMEVQPPGKGKYVLPKAGQPDNTPVFTMTVNYDYVKGEKNYGIEYLAQSQDDGQGGSLSVSNYGTVGDYVVGNFEGNCRVYDRNTQKDYGFKKVSGKFRIMLRPQER